MPETTIPIPTRRKSLEELGYQNVSTRLHPAVIDAMRLFAAATDSTTTEVIREVLTDLYNNGRFDLHEQSAAQ